MKKEIFFGKIFQEVLGISPSDVDNHFSNFRKAHSRFPQIISSLDENVIDAEGNVISEESIFQIIEEMK
ncbi:MAG: hypothetical protein AB9891_01030 [Anaerolineaceae bacterium]